MLGQGPLTKETPSLALQFAADRFALSQDVGSRSNTRFLQTGLGVVVLMLIGVSACAVVPPASQASPRLSGHVHTVAFSPKESSPGGILQLLEQKMRTHHKETLDREFVPPIKRNVDENFQKKIQEEVHRNLGKSSGGLQMSSSVMSSRSVLDPPQTKSSLSFRGGHTATKRRQSGLPPTPAPPSPPPTPSPGGGGWDSRPQPQFYLVRFGPAEAHTILDAWISRVQLYSHSQFDEKTVDMPKLKALLEQLESLRSFVGSGFEEEWRDKVEAYKTGSTTPPLQVKFLGEQIDDKALYGLYREGSEKNTILGTSDRVLAIAGGKAIAATDSFWSASGDGKVMVEKMPHGKLEIEHMAVNPMYTSGVPQVDKRSQMTQQLIGLAKRLSLVLVFDPVSESSSASRGPSE